MAAETGRETPVLRAVRTGDTAAARVGQPRDRAIEPRRIERIPHHRFATGMKTHAAALPHGNQHGIRRQPIGNQRRRVAIAPSSRCKANACRSPAARVPRMASSTATIGITPPMRARVASSTADRARQDQQQHQRGNQKPQVPPLGIRLIQQVDRADEDRGDQQHHRQPPLVAGENDRRDRRPATARGSASATARARKFVRLSWMCAVLNSCVASP